MLRMTRRRLRWKLFLSYLVVILIGAVVVASASILAVPTAFERHLSEMSTMMGGRSQELETGLLSSFRRGASEALVLAAVLAFAAALVISLIISRRVVVPVQDIMAASQRIAGGHYEERVGVPGAERPGDLDELGRLAQSFNHMAASLQETESLRRELIGDVAHELRTPLSSIKGYMEGLIDGVLPAQAETFQQVHREADRLERLVDDLQELSRVEAGAIRLELQSIAISRLVEAATSRLGRQFEEKGVALKIDLAGDLPAVRADEVRIGQVLLNLVGNALQYTPAGGRVAIRARREGSAVRVSVEDNGIGIGAEDLPHVFERFYRADKSRSRAGGGTGIGLTIARHLVEAHGGTIEAESAGPGRGSAFRFTLPAA